MNGFLATLIGAACFAIQGGVLASYVLRDSRASPLWMLPITVLVLMPALVGGAALTFWLIDHRS